MAYTLFAVLAPPVLLLPAPEWISDSKVIALEQGVSMIPVTQALYSGLVLQHVRDPAEDWAGFVLSPAPLVVPLSDLSATGVVAYVEADFFGGRGDQRCVVWRKGTLVLGPLDGDHAINRALSRLSVKHRMFHDEFEAVGLGKHRSNEEWLADVR